MPFYVVEYFSGDVYEKEEYFSPRKRGHSIPRSANENLTTEQQKEINIKQARKKLTRLINTNFNEKDLFVTLTHEKRLPLDKAKVELKKFHRKVRAYRRKVGLSELKYVCVTENENKRVHHHIVMSGMSLDVLNDIWKLGSTWMCNLYEDHDYRGLAKYLTKETTKYHQKRWTCSKNLEKPRVVEKQLKNESKLKVPKGYKLLEKLSYFSDESGQMSYIKAIKIGGTDYAEGTKHLDAS